MEKTLGNLLPINTGHAAVAVSRAVLAKMATGSAKKSSAHFFHKEKLVN